jgi:general secretion pathway protein J
MTGRDRGQAGLTLVELMLSLGLLAMMMFLAWSTTKGTIDIKKGLEKTQVRNHEIRVAMSRMVRDISSAYLSGNENTSAQVDQRRTLFIGKSTGSIDELRFSSLAHEPMWANADESEQTLIQYLDESDPDKSGQTNLVRREQRRLSDENFKNEPAEYDVLLHNVEKVRFEYWDWQQKDWKDRWDTTSADGERNRLPTRVRITIEFESSGGKKRKFTTQARIMMQEQLNVVL